MLVPAVKNVARANFSGKTSFGFAPPKALLPFEIDERLLANSPDKFVSTMQAIHRSGDTNTKILMVGAICKRMIQLVPASSPAIAKKFSTLQKTLDSFVIANV